MMHRKLQALPVQWTLATDLLVNRTGEPVWPLKNETDFASLKQLASLFHAELREERETYLRSDAPAANLALVVGLHLDHLGSDLGNLYAHLTGRRYQSIESVSQLAGQTHPSVLITSTDQLTLELMNALYPDEPVEPATGILFASDRDSLRGQVLVRSAAAVLAGPAPTRAIELYPGLEMPRFTFSGREILGARALAAELRDAVGRGPAVLSVFSHSDGMDAFLGKLTLCPMRRPPPRPDPLRPPGCQVTGICHRHDLPLEEVLQSELLMDPDDLSARIFVWATCWGVLLQPSVVDQAWALPSRIANNPRLGAVVTSWGLFNGSPRMTAYLTDHLDRGVPVGAALTHFLRSPAAQHFGVRFCLLGDPLVSVPLPGPRQEQSAVPPDQPCVLPEVPPVDPSDSGDLDLIRTIIKLQSNRMPPATELRRDHAMGSIDALQMRMFLGGDCGDGADAARSELRRSLLDLFSAWGCRAFDAWQKLAELVETSSHGPPCPVCGQALCTELYSMRIPGASARRLKSCVRCGIVEDAPDGFPPIRFTRRTPRSFAIDPALTLRRGAAVLLHVPPLTSLSARWDWPADSAGFCEEVCEASGPWPPRPFRADFVYIEGCRFAIGSLPCCMELEE